MIQHPAFTVEPWSVRETRRSHLDVLAQTESVFALANGHIGLRGNLDEGEPFGLPGTYLNGFYELRPLPYAEAGYGYPEAGQTVVNVTNGKLMRLAGRRRAVRRPLRRAASPRAAARSPRRRARAQRRVGLARRRSRCACRSTRLVSFVQRAVAAILYEVEPLEATDAGRRAVGAGRERDDARDARPIRVPRRRRFGLAAAPESPSSSATRAVVLVHSTKRSGLRMAAGMDHVVDGPLAPDRETETIARLGRVRIAADLAAGTARCGSSSSWPTAGRAGARPPALRDQVSAALPRRGTPAGRGCVAASSASISTSSGSAPTSRLEGDDELQQAVRFASVPRAAGRRAGRAAGDRGQGADRSRLRRPYLLGHRGIRPAGADLHGAGRRRRRAALAPRDARAGARAGQPARPRRAPRSRGGRSAGEECSGYWPAGTAAFHINADIADAVDALSERRRRSGVRARGRARAAGRDRAAVALARPSRRGRALPDRRRHRSGRVQRGRRQQRLHEPDGAAQPARRGRCGRAPSEARRRARRRRTRRRPSWRDARGGDARSPTTRRSASTRQAEGFTEHETWDFDADRARAVPAAAALPVLRPVSQAGRQAGRPGAGAAPARRRVHRRGEGARTSTTTSG